MKRIIFLLSFCFLFFVGDVYSQEKGTGICYFASESDLNAFIPNTEYDCEFAMIQPGKTTWCWDRDLNVWVESGGIKTTSCLLPFGEPQNIQGASTTLSDGTIVSISHSGGNAITYNGSGGVRWAGNYLDISSSNPITLLIEPVDVGDPLMLDPIVFSYQNGTGPNNPASSRLVSNGEDIIYNPGSFDAQLVLEGNVAKSGLPESAGLTAQKQFGNIVAPNGTNFQIRARNTDALKISAITLLDTTACFFIKDLYAKYDSIHQTKSIDCYVENTGINQMQLDNGGLPIGSGMQLVWSPTSYARGEVVIRIDEVNDPPEVGETVTLVISEDGDDYPPVTRTHQGGGFYDINFGEFEFYSGSTYTFDLTTTGSMINVFNTILSSQSNPVVFNPVPPDGSIPVMRILSYQGDPISIRKDTGGNTYACDQDGNDIPVPANLSSYVKCEDLEVDENTSFKVISVNSSEVQINDSVTQVTNILQQEDLDGNILPDVLWVTYDTIRKSTQSRSVCFYPIDYNVEEETIYEHYTLEGEVFKSLGYTTEQIYVSADVIELSTYQGGGSVKVGECSCVCELDFSTTVPYNVFDRNIVPLKTIGTIGTSFTISDFGGATTTENIVLRGKCGEGIPATMTVEHLVGTGGGNLNHDTTNNVIVHTPGGSDFIITIALDDPALSYSWGLWASGVGTTEGFFFNQGSEVTSYDRGPGGIVLTLPYNGGWHNNNNSSGYSAFGFDASNSISFRKNGAPSISSVFVIALLEGADVADVDKCEITNEQGIEYNTPSSICLELDALETKFGTGVNSTNIVSEWNTGANFHTMDSWFNISLDPNLVGVAGTIIDPDEGQLIDVYLVGYSANAATGTPNTNGQLNGQHFQIGRTNGQLTITFIERRIEAGHVPSDALVDSYNSIASGLTGDGGIDLNLFLTGAGFNIIESSNSEFAQLQLDGNYLLEDGSTLTVEQVINDGYSACNENNEVALRNSRLQCFQSTAETSDGDGNVPLPDDNDFQIDDWSLTWTNQSSNPVEVAGLRASNRATGAGGNVQLSENIIGAGNESDPQSVTSATFTDYEFLFQIPVSVAAGGSVTFNATGPFDIRFAESNSLAISSFSPFNSVATILIAGESSRYSVFTREDDTQYAFSDADNQEVDITGGIPTNWTICPSDNVIEYNFTIDTVWNVVGTDTLGASFSHLLNGVYQYSTFYINTQTVTTNNINQISDSTCVLISVNETGQPVRDTFPCGAGSSVGELDVCLYLDTANCLPPVAIVDYETTNVQTPVTIDVCWNDAEVDSAIESVVLKGSSAQGGVFTNNLDCTVTYTPPAALIGNDTIDYCVVDMEGDTSNVSHIVVTVTSSPSAIIVDVSETNPSNLVTDVHFRCNESAPSTSADADDCFSITLKLVDDFGAILLEDEYSGDWGTDIPTAFFTPFGITGGTQNWQVSGNWNFQGYSKNEPAGTPLLPDESLAHDIVWETEFDCNCNGENLVQDSYTLKKYREWTWDNNTYTVSPPDPNNPGVQFPNPKPPTIGGIFEVYGDPNNILSASGVPNTPGQINAFIGSVAPINNDPVEFEAFQVEDCNGIQYNIDPIAANWAASSNAAVRQAIQNICPVFNENGVRSFFNTTSYPTEQIIFKEGSAHGGWAGYWLSESTNDESCDCDYYIVRFRDVGEPQHQLGIIVRSINYLQR